MTNPDPDRLGVLFDVDGTLADTNYLHVLAWWQAFRQAGHDVPMAGIHSCVGMGGGRLIAQLLGEDRDQDQDGQIQAAHGAVYSTFWPALRTLPGATEILTRCSDAGLAVVLATSAKEAELKVLRNVLNVDSAIDATTSSTDAGASKPAPDILQAAMEAAGLRAENTVMLGDAIWDVRAAKAAGIACIGVETGGTSAAHLSSAGALEVYPDLPALLQAWDSSAIGQLLRH